MNAGQVDPASRGFPPEEFAARLSRAQGQMAKKDLAALLLTTEPEICYFTGFLTRFWESPTRPWFVVVPQSGGPVAIIPSIGEALMRQCAVDDIRTWQAPDYDDDGVSLLAEALREMVSEGHRIGLAMGLESHLRMPLADFERLKLALGRRTIRDDAGLVRDLRSIKSDREIAKLRASCAIAKPRLFPRAGDCPGRSEAVRYLPPLPDAVPGRRRRLGAIPVRSRRTGGLWRCDFPRQR
jgi:Xaa-Pro aminopeptidase